MSRPPRLRAAAAAVALALPSPQDAPSTVYYDAIEADGSLAGGRVEMVVPSRELVLESIPAPVSTLTSAFGPAPDPAHRVDIVYVGDGYTAAEIAAYTTHVDQIQPTFFDKEPFETYASYFTVHRVDVVSNESGVDNDPTQGVQRDTALDMGFWCGGTERLLCVDVGAAAAYANNAPDVDLICAIANSSMYGGAGYTSADLATAAAVNSSAIEIVLHEFGHAFGNLADEYSYGGPTNWNGGEPGTFNVSTYPSAQMATLQAKWFRWLGLNDPAFDGLVSTYEGANYSEFGIYRPTNNSLMRNLGRPFNRPSLERMVLEIYRIVSPIDDSSDTGVAYAGTETLSVTPMAPVGQALSLQWSLDGVPIPGATGASLDLSTLGLTACNTEVSVTVTDPTPWVRDEALRAQFMTATRTFDLYVENGGWSNYCAVNPNSTGQPARIDAYDSSSIAADNFTLFSGPIPPGGLGIYFVGNTAAETPFGNGYLCVGPPVQRLGLAQADLTGYAYKPVHPANLGFQPGDQKRFQYWYRNPAGGGAQFNTSDGLWVRFCE